MNLDKANELALSIKQQGLIHTILISKDGTLIAGLHRLTAYIILSKTEPGWESIPARFAYDVTEAEMLALELEENIKRHDMSWQEECQAVLKFHDMKSKTSGWSATDTAEALSMSHPQVYRYITVAREITNPRIAGASTLSAAYGICSRQTERAVMQEMELLETTQEEVEESPVTSYSSQQSIFAEDFTKWVKSYSGQRFSFIHCDFPYGVNHNKSAQGRASTWGSYEDSPEVFWNLCDALFYNLDRIMTPQGHIMFWFSMNYYTDLVQYLTHETDTGFAFPDLEFDPFPLIWHKSDNKGILPDSERGPRRSYETALLLSRGDCKIVQAVSNTYAAPTTKELHQSEKPESMLRHFFRMFVDESTKFLDPTCGSGTSLRAAEALGAKFVLGLEQDSDMATKAQESLDNRRRLSALSKNVGGSIKAGGH